VSIDKTRITGSVPLPHPAIAKSNYCAQHAEPVVRQPTAPPDSSLIARIPRGRFSISTTRGQHQVPSSMLSGSGVTRKHRAALALKPTDLWALLTEQIAHFVHF
jgi:hypothetical protein